MDESKFLALLKGALISKGVSYQNLAEVLGYGSKTSVSSQLNGHASLNLKILTAIMDIADGKIIAYVMGEEVDLVDVILKSNGLNPKKDLLGDEA